MSCMIHSFGPSGDHTAPVANGIGIRLARFVRRLSDVPGAQRQRQVDREIAGMLTRSGGPLTDSMEREMMEMALGSDWSPPR
jgi:hypothetical protein